ncbi:MAG: hypothetical protein NT007_09295 [Candidatus Kapabacteria bacterium]|nr:hypothetical protein [Candidatus Kapabacteria bacterium]
MQVNIRPVLLKSDLLKFIRCQWNFYTNDPNFVPPLISDRLKLLDKKKNPFYAHSKMQLFLAESESKIVGRIAAIVNDNHNKTHNDKTGFFGFFESIDDSSVASQLFITAEEWLKANGCDKVMGPMNPSINDEIGLLIEGFDSPPVILMTYNPQYYGKLIENAGYAKAKDLFAYHLKNETYLSEKADRMQTLIRERYQIKIRSIDFKNKKQFKEDVATLRDIYNVAWQQNWGAVKMTDEEFDFLAADLKQIADPNLCIIAEVKGKVAGFGLALPDINECLIHNKKGGLLGALWQLMTKQKKISLARIIVLGVLPEFRNIGLDAILYYEFGTRAAKRGILRGEASWILEDNLMMNRALTATMHGEVYKKYRLYDKTL